MINDFTTNRIFLHAENAAEGGLAAINRRKTEFAARLPDNTAWTRYTRVVSPDKLELLSESEEEEFREAITRLDFIVLHLDREKQKTAFKTLIRNHGKECCEEDRDERDLLRRCYRCGSLLLDGYGTLCRECGRPEHPDRVEVETYHEHLWFLRDYLLNGERAMCSKEKPFISFLNRFINPEGVPLTGDTFNFIENGVIWLTPV